MNAGRFERIARSPRRAVRVTRVGTETAGVVADVDASAERKTIAAVSRSRELSYLCLAGLLGFLALLAQLLLLLEHLGVHQRERFLLGVRQVRGDPALGGVRLALGLRVSDRSGRER